MTPTLLKETLAALGAARHDGDWRCPCRVCGGPRSVTINPGSRRLFVAFCYHCGCPGDADANRRWWSEFLRRGPRLPAESLAATDPGTVRRCWAALDPAAAADSPPAADADTLHSVYTELLDELELADADRRWLQRRGLDPDWAFAAGYRSSPYDDLRRRRTAGGDDSGGGAGPAVGVGHGDPAARLRREWGFTLKSVPGFYEVGEETRVAFRAPAVVIPCRDRFGHCFGLKFRVTDGGAARMRLLSSRHRGGPRAVVGAHCPLGVGGHRWPRLWVTEGERKADCHWLRTEQPTVAVPGAGSWRSVLPLLAELVETGGTVVVALDQDQAGHKSTPPLAAAVAAAGYRVEVASWSGKKGLDDAVTAGARVECREPPPAASGLTPTLPRTLVNGNGNGNGRQPQRRLSDHEVVDYVRRHGPLLRDDLPAYPPTVTKLLVSGQLRVKRHTSKGQLLEAVVE